MITTSRAPPVFMIPETSQGLSLTTLRDHGQAVGTARQGSAIDI